MKNQNKPANPHPSISERVPASTGETKREKAFWQVYSLMASSELYDDLSYERKANEALKAVNAGFKALESDNE